MRRGWIILAFLLALSGPVFADTIRIATYNASLSRSGPGLLLRAIEKRDLQVMNVVGIIKEVSPDILLINEFDWDVEGRAAAAFLAVLAENGVNYPHWFSSQPNTGFLSGHDMNRDGNVAGPDDAFGYGKFPGQYGMLLLSKYPVDQHGARTFANLRWRDLPDARLPVVENGGPFPSPEAQAVMRLSSKSHWDLPVETPKGRLHVLASHPTPPVFDGPEDRNGLRNADEIRFWELYLAGVPFVDDQGRQAAFDSAHFVLAGDMNADPDDGDGAREIIGGLLKSGLVRDTKPASAGAAALAAEGVNATHRGDPALDTADWNDTRGPGNLRADYVLPSLSLQVAGSGVFWPSEDDPKASLLGSGKDTASDHRLVWVDFSW